MPDMSKIIRQKRFDLKKNHDVRLLLETKTGNRFELKITNCSLAGLATVSDVPLTVNEGLEMGSIVPSSKIKCETGEAVIGRLIVRRVHQENNQCHLAFSTLDSRVPLDGMLSRYIDGEIHSRTSVYDYEISSDKFNIRSFCDSNQTNVDLFGRIDQFEIFYKEWCKTNKFQYRNIRMPSKGGRIHLRQPRKGKRNDYLVMGSNDYLGLSSDPRVLEAAKNAIDVYGFGSTGSPLTTGLSDLHEELSQFLAKLLRKEEVVLFNSGYAANLGTLTGLTTAQDIIIADFLSHASIQDALQMAHANSRFFKHNDVKHLEKILTDTRPNNVGALVVTEGIFSMEGDVAPLSDIVKVARKHNARVFLDEAHSFGVLGPNGLGCWEKFGEDKIDVVMGTFSKICGGIGGFIGCDTSVAHWLNWYARSFMFSVSIPPSTAAAALQALKIFTSEPHLVQNLRNNIKHFVTGLRELGYQIDANHEGAVIPVVIGDEAKLGIMNEVFRENGVYVIPIIYPAVSRKNCRFRFTMMATHSISDLDYVLNVLQRAAEKADFKFNEVEQEASEAA